MAFVRDTLPCHVVSRLPAPDGSEQVLEYELLDLIGAGGMAKVYRARHCNPPEWYREKHGDKPRIVAIKYMLEEVLQLSTDSLDRFVREARLLMEIKHPHVVRVINIGVDQEFRPFIVMEYVENARNLALIREIHAHRANQGTGRNPVTGKIRHSLVPVPFLVKVIRQFLSALGELHKHHIVHRDIKPENLMVTVVKGQDTVKLTDLGISKNLLSDQDAGLTTQDMVVGTPSYMSPEASCKCLIDDRTKTPWFVGPWSDIWSCGAMLYETICGQLPYNAEPGELPPGGPPRNTAQENRLMAEMVLAKVVNQNFHPRPLSEMVEDLNPELETLVMACLIKDPWDRPHDVEVLLPMLDRIEQYEQEHEGELTPVKNAAPIAAEVEPAPSAPAEDKPAAVAPQPQMSQIWIYLCLLVAVVIGAGLLYQWESEANRKVSAAGVTSAANAVPGAPSVYSAPVDDMPSAAPSGKRQPDPGPVLGSKAASIYQRGLDAARQGDCRTATTNMNAVLAVNPAFPKPFRILGDCARRAGRTDEARRQYEKYLSFDGVEPLPPEAMKLVNP